MIVLAPDVLRAVWPTPVAPPSEDELRIACFLFGRSHGVHTFLCDVVPPLLRELTRRTPREVVELRGRIRGRPDWPATIRARASGASDPNRFVCREPNHRHDTPENELLKFHLEGLHRAISNIPTALRLGLVASGDAVIPMAPRVTQLARVLRLARSHIALREVPFTTPEADHVRRASKSRNEGYRRLAALHARHAEVVNERRVPLAQLVAETIFIPASRPGHAPWTTLLFRALAGAPHHTHHGETS